MSPAPTWVNFSAQVRVAGGRGEPYAALRHPVISPDIMGSPARRLTNPITRCRDQPHHRYAGPDDGRGTDQTLDTNRLTLMRGHLAAAGSRVPPPRTRDRAVVPHNA